MARVEKNKRHAEGKPEPPKNEPIPETEKPETEAVVVNEPVVEERQATIAKTNVMRWHKTEKPRIFATGETIPPDWYDSPAGMRKE